MTIKTKLALGVVMLALAGCNTIEGLGKDVQAGGKVLEETAEDVKDSIDGDED